MPFFSDDSERLPFARNPGVPFRRAPHEERESSPGQAGGI